MQNTDSFLLIIKVFGPLILQHIFLPLFSIIWILVRHLFEYFHEKERKRNFFLETIMSSLYFYMGSLGFNTMMDLFGYRLSSISLIVFTVPIFIDIVSGFVSRKINIFKVLYEHNQASGKTAGLARLKNYSENIGSNKKLQTLNRAVIYWLGMAMITAVLTLVIGLIANFFR